MYGGHGLTTFDSIFDEDGHTRHWWDHPSNEEYDEKSRCMVDQYNEFVFSINGTKHTANGEGKKSTQILPKTVASI